MSQTLDQTSAPTLAQLVLGDNTPRKAFYTALVVGSVLTMINHGDLILAGGSPPLLKVVLTYCVPYCVTTWGAIMGKRAQWQRDRSE
ncbi:MAG: nitrate/nitrite transporter NrtS [Rhodospirillaceae bacterium]|jgi:hypothetical protein|nr:nitrate/nitrite transporter NrtS [Rhodospirillaceae bacterium]MBT4044921.1 nitrate/nitrite transporter NrtS [Rhodospirillaceae bacterium]MBT4686641.1 nitrate/nitrite transporter NrtS [Rhodospirillaceae bacterium]MBT5082227.1 nitrate/nitrite transporter NrtS [Rhodospirillaceae bacterium]MBT5526746.1 nitrate/nitrite transporter NrtS [Rhodospirillaceae bacterium]